MYYSASHRITFSATVLLTCVRDLVRIKNGPLNEYQKRTSIFTPSMDNKCLAIISFLLPSGRALTPCVSWSCPSFNWSAFCHVCWGMCHSVNSNCQLTFTWLLNLSVTLQYCLWHTRWEWFILLPYISDTWHVLYICWYVCSVSQWVLWKFCLSDCTCTFDLL